MDDAADILSRGRDKEYLDKRYHVEQKLLGAHKADVIGGNYMMGDIS
jgi:hypothetical protein